MSRETLEEIFEGWCVHPPPFPQRKISCLTVDKPGCREPRRCFAPESRFLPMRDQPMRVGSGLLRFGERTSVSQTRIELDDEVPRWCSKCALSGLSECVSGDNDDGGPGAREVGARPSQFFRGC